MKIKWKILPLKNKTQFKELLKHNPPSNKLEELEEMEIDNKTPTNKTQQKISPKSLT